MLVLTAPDVRRCFSMSDALSAVRRAAEIHTYGQADAPARHQLATASPEGEMLVMPGVAEASLFGLKLWYRFAEPPRAMPRSSASILLLDPASGQEVLMDGEIITDLRTGALTGVAAHHLADPQSREIGIVGAGIQARTQILALVDVLPSVRRIRVFARTKDRLDAFVASMRAELTRSDLAIDAAESAEAACTGADVLVAATTSSTPVIRDDWVGPGALVCGVGSHDRESAELAAATVQRAGAVVVDTELGGIDGAGDIHQPIQRGLIRRADVLELGHLVSGERTPKLDAGDVRVFKSVGFAVSDIVAASMVARRAIETGVGSEVDLHAAASGGG